MRNSGWLIIHTYTWHCWTEMLMTAVKTTSNVSKTQPWLCSCSAGRAACGVCRGSCPCCPNADSCCSRQFVPVAATGRHAHHCTRLSTGMAGNSHTDYIFILSHQRKNVVVNSLLVSFVCLETRDRNEKELGGAYHPKHLNTQPRAENFFFQQLEKNQTIPLQQQNIKYPICLKKKQQLNSGAEKYSVFECNAIKMYYG